ncbi:MAG: hypothetical protein NZ874_09145 [Fimbriimonadales bacterium]|nr:hypothetical protein [Fimbriimonadales bacterium]
MGWLVRGSERTVAGDSGRVRVWMIELVVWQERRKARKTTSYTRSKRLFENASMPSSCRRLADATCGTGFQPVRVARTVVSVPSSAWTPTLQLGQDCPSHARWRDAQAMRVGVLPSDPAGLSVPW